MGTFTTGCQARLRRVPPRTIVVIADGESSYAPHAVALDCYCACDLDRLASDPRVYCLRTRLSPDCGPGNRAGERQARTVPQNHHVPSDHPDAGDFLVRDQRDHDRAGLCVRARISRFEFCVGVLGRNRPDDCELAAEMADPAEPAGRILACTLQLAHHSESVIGVAELRRDARPGRTAAHLDVVTP